MKNANQPTGETALWETLSDEELETVVGGFMPNFFKQGKDAFFVAIGGVSKPFVIGIKDIETMIQTDDGRQNVHNILTEGLEKATGPAKEQLEALMEQFRMLTT